MVRPIETLSQSYDLVLRNSLLHYVVIVYPNCVSFVLTFMNGIYKHISRRNQTQSYSCAVSQGNIIQDQVYG